MNASTALIMVSIILTLIMLVSNSTINLILAEPIVANPNTVTKILLEDKLHLYLLIQAIRNSIKICIVFTVV